MTPSHFYTDAWLVLLGEKLHDVLHHTEEVLALSFYFPHFVERHKTNLSKYFIWCSIHCSPPVKAQLISPPRDGLRRAAQSFANLPIRHLRLLHFNQNPLDDICSSGVATTWADQGMGEPVVAALRVSRMRSVE